MILPIVKWPDRLLHCKSVEVFPSDFKHALIKELVENMWETMYDAGGIGLSAIQVGQPLRLMVMDVYKPYVMINPVLTELLEPKAKMNEGCLSIPGYVDQMDRYAGVKVTYFDLNGDGQVSDLKLLEAQVVQHEVDHMNGIVMPDVLGPAARTRLASKMAKLKDK